MFLIVLIDTGKNSVEICGQHPGKTCPSRTIWHWRLLRQIALRSPYHDIFFTIYSLLLKLNNVFFINGNTVQYLKKRLTEWPKRSNFDQVRNRSWATGNWACAFEASSLFYYMVPFYLPKKYRLMNSYNGYIYNF